MLKYIIICKIIYKKYNNSNNYIVITICTYYFFNKTKINFMIDQTGKFFCIGTMHKFSNYLLLNFSL